MARRKRKTKKKLSLWNKMKSHFGNAKHWVLDHVHDHDFLPAMSFMVVGLMLVFQCLDPWLTLGFASLLIGGKKMWDLARW